MKEIYMIDETIGSDGFKVKGAVGVLASDLSVQLTATYPIEKIIEPAIKVADEMIDKIEKIIPGDWDMALLEKVKAEYKQKLIELLSE